MLDWLLSYAVQSTLLLLAAWLFASRTRSHLVRETLWKTALVGGFVTATAQVALGIRPFAGRVVVAAAAPAARAPTPDRAGDSPADGGLTRRGTAPAATAPRALGSSAASGQRLDATALAVRLWLSLAALLLLGYLLRRMLLARRIAHRRPVMTHPLAELLRALSSEAGIRRPIRLTVSPRLASPIALGSSEIAVPEAALTELDADQQRGMLAHELAHLERRDPAWLLLIALIERIAFFQPLNRLARLRIQESAEYLCDEWAVRSTGSGVFLAKCLAKVAEWMDTRPSAVPLAGMAEERSHLVARVRRLLDGDPFPMGPRRGTVALLAGVGVLGVALGAPSLSLERQSAGAPERQASVPERRSAGASDTSRAVIRALMDASRDSDGEVRRAALRSLANYEDPETLPVFRTALRDGDAEIRATAVRALADLKDKSSAGAIAVLLKDENTEVRRHAAGALGDLRSGSVKSELVAALKDSDAEVRARVIRALAELKDPGLVDVLVAAMKDPNADVRARAIDALGDMENLSSPPAGLLDALKDPNADVRQNAARAVGHFEDVRAVPALKAMLEDPSADVREAAVEALADIRNDAAIDALVSALKSKDPKIRRAAADALGKH